MRIGCHLSIAGGLHKALERAADLDTNALQIFSHNARSWAFKPLDDDEPTRFRRLGGERRTVEETNDRVGTIEDDLDEQRALLEAVADANGVDVEALRDGDEGDAGDGEA